MRTWPEKSACVTAKGIMNVYAGRPFCTNIASIGMVDVHLRRHQKVGKVANALNETVYTRDERYTNPPSALVNDVDSVVNAVHYSPFPKRLEHMPKYNGVKEKDEKKHKND